MIRRRWRWFAPLGLVGSIIFVTLYSYPDLQENILRPSKKDTVCRFEPLDPWDNRLLPKDRVKESEHPECEKTKFKPLKQENDGRISYTDEGNEANNISCKYREFEHNSGVDDMTPKFDDEWSPLPKEGYLPGKDFIQVQCNELVNGTEGEKVFSYSWARFVPKDGIQNVTSDLDHLHLSVLFFQLESTSLSQYRRKLPKTQAIFEHKLRGIIFDRHLRNGRNTLPNTFAFLTGKKEHQLGGMLRDSFYEDHEEFIWHNFKRNGYVTAWLGDAPWMDCFILNGNQGFKYKPTDHYLRTYWKYISEDWDGGIDHHRQCYGESKSIELNLGILERFIRDYGDRRTFAYHTIDQYSHDYMNNLQRIDNDLSDFLNKMSDHFNHTVIILLGDHGFTEERWEETELGSQEANRPLLGIALPSWLPDSLKDNLMFNAKNSMTSQVDVYATLTQLASGNLLKDITKDHKLHEGGMSLFRKIPRDRTLEMALVDPEFSPCSPFWEASSDPDEVNDAEVWLLDYINANLKNYSDFCVTYNKIWDNLSLINDKDGRLTMMTQIEDPKKIVFRSRWLKPPEGVYQLVELERQTRVGNTTDCLKGKDAPALVLNICTCH